MSHGSLLLPELMTLVTMEMVYFKGEEHEMKPKETNVKHRTDIERDVCVCAALLLVRNTEP